MKSDPFAAPPPHQVAGLEVEPREREHCGHVSFRLLQTLVVKTRGRVRRLGGLAVSREHLADVGRDLEQKDLAWFRKLEAKLRGFRFESRGFSQNAGV